MRLFGHQYTINKLAWSPDCKKLVSAGYDDFLLVWDVCSGNLLFGLKGHSCSIGSVVWLAESNQIVSISWDNTLIIWSGETGEMIDRVDIKKESRLRQGFISHMVWSPDNKIMLVSCHGSSLQVWDIVDGLPEFRREIITNNAIMSLSFNPDGKNFIATSFSESINLWNVETLSIVKNIQLNQNSWPFKTVWSPDGNKISYVSNSASTDEQNIYLLNVNKDDLTFNKEKVYRMEAPYIADFTWSSDSRKIVSLNNDSTILKLWHINSSNYIFEFQSNITNKQKMKVVSWSPDGNRIACAGEHCILEIIYTVHSGDSVGFINNVYDEGIFAFNNKKIKDPEFSALVVHAAESNEFYALIDWCIERGLIS